MNTPPKSKKNDVNRLSSLSTLLAVISFLADLLAISVFFISASGIKIYLSPSVSFGVIVFILIGITYALTRTALTYYQKRALQIKSKLEEKESGFFQTIESDVSNILAEKVQ